MNAERIAGIGAFAVVVAGIAIGFATIGPPQHMRLIELDHRRVDDLRTIVRSVHYAAAESGPNPATAPPRSHDDWPRDPGTGRPYEYRRESAARYRLCANFGLPSDADTSTWVSAAWRHGAGRTCYRLDARNVELEPVYEPVELR